MPQKRRTKVDYVRNNAWEVIKKSPKRFPIEEENENQPNLHNSFGKLPRYLLERQREVRWISTSDAGFTPHLTDPIIVSQWAHDEEERRRSAPDPDCPPGMVRLDEKERVKTLEILRKNILFVTLGPHIDGIHPRYPALPNSLTLVFFVITPGWSTSSNEFATASYWDPKSDPT